MSRLYLSTVLLFVFSFVNRVRCLSAISGSPCYDPCNGGSATSSGDIVCLDSDWTGTQKGQTLSKCMTCLQTSTFRQGPMTDEILFMYYLSTVQQTCLSGPPAAPISNCSNQCDNVDSSFSGLGGVAFFQSPYGYCSANSNAYTSDAVACSTCLAGQGGVVTLSNFIYTGNTACQQQPDLESGGSLSFASSLFATTALAGPVSSTVTSSAAPKTASQVSGSASSVATTRSTSVTSTGSSATSAHSSTTTSTKATGTAATSNSNSDGSKKADASNSSHGLSRGAAAGIGIALGIVGVALIVLFAILARRRMLAKQGSGPFSKMRDRPEMRQAPAALPTAMPLPEETERGATPPAAGVFVPPAAAAPAAQPKTSKSFKSSKTWKSMTPRTSEWFWAANPKEPSDLSALPQRGWD